MIVFVLDVYKESHSVIYSQYSYTNDVWRAKVALATLYSSTLAMLLPYAVKGGHEEQLFLRDILEEYL